jgi:hypothetical protein
MKRSDRAPKARRSQLVIKELATETLIYDESNHQAHCLNQTAAFVWKHCDGRTSLPALARLLEKETNVSVPEHTVRSPLSNLRSRTCWKRPPRDHLGLECRVVKWCERWASLPWPCP